MSNRHSTKKQPVVWWAEKNFLFPQMARIVMVPEEGRAPNLPILYTVTLSEEFMQKFVKMEAEQARPAAG